MELLEGTDSVLAKLLAALRNAADFNSDDAAAPAVVLWPDEKREWERLIPRLLAELPHFLVLGEYNVAKRTGPAIWVRCVLGRVDTDVAIPPDVAPVLYMPGVSRATLRATDDCPADLKPLAELQYRGVFWSQQNAKDWTISAFLQSASGGLGLKIAKGTTTAAAIRLAVDRLMDVPVSELQAKSVPLDADDFSKLISDDPVDDLLTWMSDPQGTKTRWDNDRWATLCGVCKAQYGFDPDVDGEAVAADNLGARKNKAWAAVWKRFTATPARYAGLTDLLRKAKPSKSELLFGQAKEETWPQDNEAEEADLRSQLAGLAGQPAVAARKMLVLLDGHHGRRRDWPWAKLGRSPLAGALVHLRALAEATSVPSAGASVSDVIQSYVNTGWKADAAMLDAIGSSSRKDDRDAIGTAIRAVYAPWLRDGAEHFQAAVKVLPLPGRESDRLGRVDKGGCVLFVDALRYDLGMKVRDRVSSRGLTVELSHYTAAMPSVTPTAKPAVSPVASKIIGVTAGVNFVPSVASDTKDLTTDRFRKLLDDAEFQYLDSSETGDVEGRAWTEIGKLDQTGHNEGCGLANRIPELIELIANRIESLLAAGWKEVRVVTDHGWLLMPGGLPKTELPKYLTATRWGRCAAVKPTATVDLPCYHWFWSDDVRMACPPGIDCFGNGYEYSHGGLTVQECVLPRLVVTGSGVAKESASIESVKWSGLRCRVKVAGPPDGLTLDLREKAASAATSILSAPKAVGKDGQASLVVADDTYADKALYLVLIDASGSVVEKKTETVGG